MDMGADYPTGTRHAAPKALIVHDKFRVSKLLNEAVDRVRKDEHRRLSKAGDDSLKGTKYWWFDNAAPEAERAQSFEELCERNLKTSRAWAHKETFNEFWKCQDA